MKRVFKTVSLIALVALVAVSCKKNTEQAKDINITIEEVQGLDTPDPSLDGSKAYVDLNGIFRWNDGDRVTVYNLYSDYTKSESAVYEAANGCEGNIKAQFSGTLTRPKGDLGYYLFYSPTLTGGEIGTSETNSETFYVNDTQYYSTQYLMDRSALVLATTTTAQANGGNIDDFKLQHFFGLLDVVIADNKDQNNRKSVESIVVNDNAWNLSGSVSLKLPEVDAQRFTNLLNMLESNNAGYAAAMAQYKTELGYVANPEGKTITLVCNDFQLPWRQWQHFIIPIRPGALYLGFTVTVNYTDGTSYTFNPTENGKDPMDYLIKPNWFKKIYITTQNGFLQ